MATSVFFNNYGSSQEQKLLEDLIIESIRIHGQDMYYLPRNLNNFDSIYGADDISSFDRAYQIEVYIKNTESFNGEGSLMSKFGLEIRDQITFTVAQRVFKDEITAEEDDIARPREGDLLYFPLNKKLFEIKYVEDKPFFYALGTLTTYDMYCELYQYSNEEFDTGITEVDDIQEKVSTNILDYGISAQDGRILVNEDGLILVPSEYTINDVAADNDEIQRRSDLIVDFSEQNPWAEDDF